MIIQEPKANLIQKIFISTDVVFEVEEIVQSQYAIQYLGYNLSEVNNFLNDPTNRQMGGHECLVCAERYSNSPDDFACRIQLGSNGFLHLPIGFFIVKQLMLMNKGAETPFYQMGYEVISPDRFKTKYKRKI